MWFGTLDGLNRFDGYEFKVYHNKFRDTTSLLSNVVYGITEDKKGRLWLATRLGVCRLNILNDRFTTIYYNSKAARKTLRLDREVIKTVACDGNNNILIASELQGLMICKDAAAVAEQVPLAEGSGVQIFQYGVQAICFDKRVGTLAFVQGKGICILNHKKQRLELLNNTLKYVNSMLSDGDYVWLATNEGVYSFDLLKNRVEQKLSVENSRLKSNLNIALTQDSKNRLYVGTMGGGLSIYDKLSGNVQLLQAGEGRNDLSSSGIYSLFVDNGARLWIGTRRGGINFVDPGKRKFTTVAHEPGNIHSLSGNFITSVCEMPDGVLLVGTEDNGLNLVDTKAGRYTHYRSNPADPASLSSNNVNNIKLDRRGNIWLATYTNGICRFFPQTKTFKRYSTVNTKTGVENKVFNVFYEDADNTLWASALRQGNYFGALYRYNKQKDVFEMFDDKLSDIFSMTEDNEGNLWGGGITELIKIDRVNKKHRSFYIGQFIRTITDEGNGKLWLGTEGGGLVLFDSKNGKVIERYTTENGLSNNSIFSTLRDDKGQLWLGTFNGLSRFNIKSRKFKNYYRGDGLESDQFHFNAAARLRSGAFVFGGIKGYNIFYPDSIGVSAGNAPLHFTEILVDGKRIEQSPDFISQTEGSTIKTIAVPYDNAVFSFSFAALEYAVPDKISYAYFMEGWDKGWNYTGNIHAATYTHLSEGRYLFKVKSTNGDGVWSNEIAIPVIVYPPWYRSWWAYSLYCLALASLVYVYLNYRSGQAKLKYEVNLQKVEVQREKAEREKREVELALEKAEHEKYATELQMERTQRALEHSERETEKAIADKEREVNERRASFFTSISHEFRTPLSLIINPIKDILARPNLLPEKEDRELNIVYRNARRMLSLTNQLLLFRREESGLDKVHPSRLNLAALCNEVFLCFAQQAAAKNVSYQFNCAEQDIELYGDRDKLEIIFFNLLSNALKYVPGSGTVLLSVTDHLSHVMISVTDNGPGIAGEARHKLFEKFYQAKDTGRAVKAGFGIGLYLVRQFAEAHHGTVNCTDTPGGGATFTVQLLKGKAHFTEADLMHDTPAGQSVFEEMKPEFAANERHSPLLAEVGGNIGQLVASEKQAILVVDDDMSIREYLKLAFGEAYQVYEAGDGKEGIQAAEKLLPDIIISDIMMAGTSGIDLCKAVKNNPALSHIPVILLTGTSSEDLKLKGVQDGADDYIMKPFDKELLLARVNNLLKNRNSLQRYFYNEITLNSQDAKISDQYRLLLEQCIDAVEDHLEDEQFNSKKLAQQMGMSYSSLTKKMKAISGQSLNSFIRFVRLRKAARLFIDSNSNVNEVASIVGIFDARYFREQFSRQFGMNPSEFIKKYRKPFANRFTVNKDLLKGS